jgi:hypothetical protein
MGRDAARRRVSKSWDWNGVERWWETTFTPIGTNGLGEVVGCERWFWNGSDSEVRRQYVAESMRTPDWMAKASTPAATGDHPSEARRGQGAAGDQGGPDAR